MNANPNSNRAVVLAVLASVCLLAPGAALAQTAAPEGPLPPPAVAPESRMTVLPGEFEQWMAGLTPSDEPAVATESDTPPSLVQPPPPPPVLVQPPPPPATLVQPPAPPKLAPVPASPPAAASPPAGEPASPEAPAPGLTPPPAPVIEAPEEPRVATLPPDSPITTPLTPPVEPLARPDVLKILYPAGDMEVPDSAKPDLDRLAAWLRQNPAVRLEIVGYASGQDATGGQARRTALYRTLAVRKYLVENGVLSARMNVRALGDKTDEEPRDRVEISMPPS